MVTLREAGSTDSEESINAPRRRCVYCRGWVIWMITCHQGRPFAFDAEPIARKYDDGTGWAPGRFMIRARLRLCLAPLMLHPPAKRRRVSHVMQLHSCARRRGAA